MNAAIRETIRANGRVEVETATQVRADIDGQSVIADLWLRPYRLLAENAALVAAFQLGHVIENL
jgi:hypothetical protein